MLFKTLTSTLLLSTLLLKTHAYELDLIKKDFHKQVTLKSSILREKNFKLTKTYSKKAKELLQNYSDKFEYTQFVTLVDLSQQILILTIYDKDKDEFFIVGFDYISSGDINREIETKPGEDHYVKTPSGIFKIKSGWRSNGKLNDDNTSRPYGKKGRFVFFFGTQDSVRYNTFDKNGTKIKDKKKWMLIKDKLELAMHAHSGVENFGNPQSHGCVRMSEELNEFLDNNFVFFAHLLDKKKWTHPYEPSPANPKNHDLAGNYVVITNSVF